MVFNYPGNPDGLTYTESELTALTTVFRKYNILVISDEIYGLLNHQGNHVSLARFYPEGTIITTGLSKWCGAGGWRLGVALLPTTIEEKLKKTMIGIASETYSCASTPVQYAAIDAYQIGPDVEAYLAHQRRILNRVGILPIHPLIYPSFLGTFTGLACAYYEAKFHAYRWKQYSCKHSLFIA
jgi:aspartate aminotransferase